MSKAVAKPKGVKNVLVDRDGNVEDDSFGEDVSSASAKKTQTTKTKNKSASETYTKVWHSFLFVLD